MWPNTFNKKCATISGWQCLGDFAAVKQQLQKIRASTRISSKKSEEGGGGRPLPPLPQQGNKSVRFALPEGGVAVVVGSEVSSDQGYESDQSRERRRQLEMPGLLQRLASLGSGRGGTLTRYDDSRVQYGPQKTIQESDRDLSTSSPVLLQLYDAVKVEPDPSSSEDQVQAAIQRLASSEHLDRGDSYDLVLGLVRRPQQEQQGCRHPSTPPPSRHTHCPCHHRDPREPHHHCGGARESQRRPRSRPESPGPSSSKSRSRQSSPSPRAPLFSKSRSRPSSPGPSNTQPKSRWSFGKKAKRSASAERGSGREAGRHGASVELGWRDLRPGMVGKWEDTGSRWDRWDSSRRWEWEARAGQASSVQYSTGQASTDSQTAATTAQLAGDLCRRATALRRTLYKMPGLINQRHAFLEIIKDVASEMKLLLDSASRLAPLLPDNQRMELDLARRKLLETSRSFSNALKGYFKEPQATPVLLAATALVYRTDEIIQALEP